MKALVLSGGGANGSYQVGVVKYLAEIGKEYNIYSGVSVGSINAIHLAAHKKDQFLFAAKSLHDLWANLETKNVYKRWFPFGKVHALWKQSLYNTAPLKKFIEERIQQQLIIDSGNKLRIGAVSLTTGQFTVFDENFSDLLGAVMGSSAFPLMFPPYEVDGQLYMDGGIRTVIPIKAAIDAGATELDIIITDPADPTIGFNNKEKTLGVAGRCLSIMVDEIMDNDLAMTDMVNELVMSNKSNKKLVKVNVVRPLEPLGDSFDFSSGLNKERAKKGYEDAKAMIK